MSKITINTDDKYFCYILGLIWADGYLYKNRVEITMIHEDLITIEHIFNTIGYWSRYERIRKNKNHKKQLILRVNDKHFSNFLKENDYNIKSESSPTKILSIIPESNKVYFIRGIFDGDGCFYRKGSINQCIFTSNYNQNWEYLISNLKSNFIYNVNIGKQQSKNGNRSFLRITSKNVIKFGQYLYNKEIFGLERKYLKYKDIENYYLSPKKRIGNNKKKIIIDNILYDSITDSSNTLSIKRDVIRYRLKSTKYDNYNYSN